MQEMYIQLNARMAFAKSRNSVSTILCSHRLQNLKILYLPHTDTNMVSITLSQLEVDLYKLSGCERGLDGH